MDSLVQDRIYRRIGLIDYQGVCLDKNNPYNAAHKFKPLHGWIIDYVVSFAATWLSFMPQSVTSWAHYESNYLEKDIKELEDPNYTDDYDDDDDDIDEDDMNDVQDHELSTPEAVRISQNFYIKIVRTC